MQLPIYAHFERSPRARRGDAGSGVPTAAQTAVRREAELVEPLPRESGPVLSPTSVLTKLKALRLERTKVTDAGCAALAPRRRAGPPARLLTVARCLR